ncbi:MAG: bifunctional heptose 7-phosphate kinase/heptose 1-phosphate adenyltransferase [Fimbriimonadaceae bacterium]
MSYSELLDSFAGLRAVVIGDVMLDEYIVGSVERISPEAPVMVVKKTSSRWVPGGAANVAKNIAALGGEAVVLGIVGADDGGILLNRGIDAAAGMKGDLVADPARVTTRKTRVMANHSHQVLRIDEEDTTPISDEAAESLLRDWSGWLETADVVLMSDYRKGLLTAGFVARFLERASQKGVPVLANAKPESARYFGGADLVSLNRAEVGGVLGDKPKDRMMAAGFGSELLKVTGSKAVLITLGEGGMVACSKDSTFEIAAPEVEAYDVAGAGDTVLATVGMGLTRSGFSAEIFGLAAEMGAKVVQHIGVAVPSQKDLDSIRSL